MKPTKPTSCEEFLATLTYGQIQEILFGAETVILSEEGLTGYKYCEKTLEYWASLGEVLHTRALASTGLRLDFETDATFLSFDVTGKFELLRNGELLLPPEEGTHTVTAELTGTPCRITLVFPSHEGGILHKMQVNRDALISPHQYSTKFVFYGDSITQGWNSGTDTLSYAWRTTLHFNADARIYGVGGAYFDGNIFEVPENFLPDKVFIAYGTNDFSRFSTLEELRSVMVSFVDKAVSAYGAEKILGIVPPWRYDRWEKSMGTFDQCQALIEEEYEKRGIAVFRAADAIPHEKTFYADGCHPNASGFGAYAEKLIEVLENA